MELSISLPAGGDDTTAARSLMGQLGITGEVSGKVTHSASGGLDFQIVRPGDIYEIRADFNKGRAKINHIQLNRWGVLHMLHSFTGVRRADPTLHRNWWVTGIWSFSMDALAAGLLVMVISGVYLWYSRTRQRYGGMLALTLGIVSLAIFLVAH